MTSEDPPKASPTARRGEGTDSEVSRRDVLAASLSAAGALVLATWLPGCGREARYVEATGELAPNAWIRIGSDDVVTLVLDRVEMGQGTMTSHAMLVGEELDVDPSKIRTEFAGAHRAYDNPAPDMGFQITGGSTSVASSFEPLRRAAATVREMLRRAGARRLSAPLDDCRVADGAVVHAKSGKSVRYGQLTREAAREEPLPAPLKRPNEFRFLGKSQKRVDARAKSDGSAVYGIDVKLPDLLTAVILRAPRIDAKVASYDASAVRVGQDGIVAVVEVPNGVAVVATSYWRARRAAAKVAVRWTGGTPVSSDRLRADFLARAKESAKVVRSDGSFPPSPSNVRLIEAVYEAPYLAHATMEPQNATARRTGDRWEVWAPTQSPGLAVEEVRRVTGAAYEDIVVHQTFVGGGFGRRLAQDYVTEAVHVSRALGGRPVKVVWSREDDFQNDSYRPMTVSLLRAAVRGSSLEGWFHRLVSQSIVRQVLPRWAQAVPPSSAPVAMKAMLGRTLGAMYAGRGMEDKTAHEGASDFAYAIPNLRVESAQVEPGVPVGFWRSVGFSENVFVVESFLDEVAHGIGADPFALRRKLLAHAPRNLGVLEAAAERAGWSKPAPPGVFRGIAQSKAFNSYCAQVADVSVKGSRVKVERITCAIDCGLAVNPDGIQAQVESAIAFGLGAALHQEITFDGGVVRETNFDTFEPLRLHEMPEVDVVIVPSNEPPSGVGEPGLPPVAPAVANAIFAATGRRIRSMPLLRALESSSS
jgi:isoquinoline 1-oxidoreductase/isoquinoline 1-oxidoreductase beta subunit